MKAENLKSGTYLIVKQGRDVFKMHVKEVTKESVLFRNFDIDSDYQRMTKGVFDVTFLIIEML